jgi:hypothetical protein
MTLTEKLQAEVRDLTRRMANTDDNAKYERLERQRDLFEAAAYALGAR